MDRLVLERNNQPVEATHPSAAQRSGKEEEEGEKEGRLLLVVLLR